MLNNNNNNKNPHYLQLTNNDNYIHLCLYPYWKLVSLDLYLILTRTHIHAYACATRICYRWDCIGHLWYNWDEHKEQRGTSWPNRTTPGSDRRTGQATTCHADQSISILWLCRTGSLTCRTGLLTCRTTIRDCGMGGNYGVEGWRSGQGT